MHVHANVHAYVHAPDKDTSLGIPVPRYDYWGLPGSTVNFPVMLSGSVCSRLPVSFKFQLRSPTTFPTMLTTVKGWMNGSR